MCLSSSLSNALSSYPIFICGISGKYKVYRKNNFSWKERWCLISKPAPKPLTKSETKSLLNCGPIQIITSKADLLHMALHVGKKHQKRQQLCTKATLFLHPQSPFSMWFFVYIILQNQPVICGWWLAFREQHLHI